jgi:hypothetical protein
MDFKTAAKLGNFLSKDYAEAFFELLVNYKDISASEAASRLNLHINTAQEFLEAMALLDIVDKKEVIEGKRPYNRYSLKTDHIKLDLDLNAVRQSSPGEYTSRKIREALNAPVRFTTSRNGQALSSVAIWKGKGRNRSEKKINLTSAQGRFLYHLPFPDAEPLLISAIMSKAGIETEQLNEIIDIVEILVEYKVIESSI